LVPAKFSHTLLAQQGITQVNQLTRNRNELKYLLPRASALRLRKLVAENLARHVHTPGKMLTLVSTIYFDTPDFFFLRQNEDNPKHNAKIRAKEYYYFDAELVEHARDFDSLFEYPPHVFLEIKSRTDDVTAKKRVQIPKTACNDVLRFIAENQSQECVDFFKAIRDLLARTTGDQTIAPASIANYQRDAFQDQEGTLRISFDSDLTFHRPPIDLFAEKKALIKEHLPPALGNEKNTILEIKYLDVVPAWLSGALRDLPQSDFSKFRACAQCVRNAGT